MKTRNRLSKSDTPHETITKITERLNSKQSTNNHCTKTELALDLTALFIAKLTKEINDYINK
jgi:hypothetical protein